MNFAVTRTQKKSLALGGNGLRWDRRRMLVLETTSKSIYAGVPQM